MSKLNHLRVLAAMDATAQAQIKRLSIVDCVDSSNTWLTQHGDCGDVCVAEQQTAGRGRRDKQWISPAGKNIYVSLRCCFTLSNQSNTLLGLYVGLLMAEMLDEWGIEQHGVKWPNDLYWRGKKLGGILIEHRYNSPDYIIGLGLNVNMSSNEGAAIDQPWCSLQQILGQPVDRNALLALLLSRLIQGLNQFPQLSFQQWHSRWQRWDLLAGKSIDIQQQRGIANGIDPQGRLQLVSDDGLHCISSADIQLQW